MNTQFFIGAIKVTVTNQSKRINSKELNEIIGLIEYTIKKYKHLLGYTLDVPFYIVDEDARGIEAVTGSETESFASCVVEEPFHIEIVAKAILFRKFYADVTPKLAHELKHFNDFSRSERLRLTEESRTKLHELTKKLTKNLKQISRASNGTETWEELRDFYGNFFRALQIEGLGYYAEVDPEITPKQYLNLRKSAEYSTSILEDHLKREKLARFVSAYYNMAFRREFITAPYKIGIFLVFSLLYHHVKTMDEIVRMPFMRFIQTCEALQEKLGETVLVSITSGRGILDYKRLLKEAREYF